MLSTNPDFTDTISRHHLIKHILPLLVRFSEDDDVLCNILDLITNILRLRTAIVCHIRDLGGIVIIYNLLLSNTFKIQIRYKASTLISIMCQDHQHGSEIIDYVLKFVTANFRSKFSARPDLLIQMIDSDHESVLDGRFWNHNKRQQICKFLASESVKLTDLMPKWNGIDDIWSLSRLNEI